MTSNLENAYELYKAGVTEPNSEISEKAIKMLTEIIERNERADEALNLRWHIYYLRRNYARALEDLNHAIFITPDFRQAFYNRGVLKQHIKDYQGAFEDFKTSIDLAKQQDDEDLIDAIEHHITELEELIKNT